MDYAEKLNQKQRDHREGRPEDVDRKEASWLDNSSVDAWRHLRMLSFVDPILKACPGSTWLTVGDGRYAFETRYLRQRDPECDVTTSDISPRLLVESKRLGLIQKYSVENCEALSFAENSFDFVLCKESFHHFPRPYQALYEMIRVSRRAVVLIEPSDAVFDTENYRRILRLSDGYLPFRDLFRVVLRKMGVVPILRKLRGLPVETKTPEIQAYFEPSGNLIYSISEREMTKVALALGMPALAFGHLNDYYEEGVEYEKSSPDSEIFKRVREKIREADASGSYGMLAAILFHEQPDETLKSKLQLAGYHVPDLPANPYARNP